MNNKCEYAVFKHNALLLCVQKFVKENDSDEKTYEGTRYAWRIDKKRADKAEIVVALIHGKIKEVFVVTEWLPATKTNFPGRKTEAKRYGFIGTPASEKIRALYVGKRTLPVNRLYGPIGYVGI